MRRHLHSHSSPLLCPSRCSSLQALVCAIARSSPWLRLERGGDRLTGRTYTASTVRILRLSTNSFLSSLDLVMQTISTFDPALPQPTDEELAEQSRIANSGNVKGIELRGDGKGAGSGEEIKG